MTTETIQARRCPTCRRIIAVYAPSVADEGLELVTKEQLKAEGFGCGCGKRPPQGRMKE